LDYETLELIVDKDMNKISFINLYCLEDEFVRLRIKLDNNFVDTLTLSKLYLSTASKFTLMNKGL
jgi:hypothetical protein